MLMELGTCRIIVYAWWPVRVNTTNICITMFIHFTDYRNKSQARGKFIERSGSISIYIVTEISTTFIFIMFFSLSIIHEITGKRGFSLSRSTYISSGHYGAHWLGDNASEWPYIKLSIIGTLEMNLFGIPIVCCYTSIGNGQNSHGAFCPTGISTRTSISTLLNLH